jgi:ADP-ribose pyrophosphatase
LKVTGVKKITDYRFLNMFEIFYQDKTGKDRMWQLASRSPEPKCTSGEFESADAVVIVPLHLQQQKLVIIKEFRVPLGGYQYGFPAGLIDEGESMFDSVRRELKEETGLQLIDILKTSPPIYSSSGLSDESISMVYVTCEGAISSEFNTANEDITAMFVSAAEAGELCEDETLKFDVKTWLVLSTFARHGDLGI